MNAVRTFVVALVVLATGLVAGAPTAGATAQTSSGFVIVHPPATGPGAELLGVDAVSAGNVWAVGDAGNTNLTLQWTGSAWHVVAAPHPGSSSSLTAVGHGGGAVWAVGTKTVANTRQGEALRWTGGAWHSVGVPAIVDVLQAVKVFSNSDVWAGGEDQNGSYVLIHWNGSSWTEVTDLDFHGAADDYIDGLAGTPTRVLAILNADGGDGSDAVLERGSATTTWKGLGYTSGDITDLYALSASSATNAWAVGASYDLSTSVNNPVAYRYNGSTFKKVTVPSYSTNHVLNGVVAISTTNVWAVGGRTTSASLSATLIEHYTGGSSFTDLGGPNVPGKNNQLQAITEVPGAPGNLWAVGQEQGKVLILHHS